MATLGVALLHTGATMPLVGLGTWQATDGVVQNAITTALEAGYRHIDCATCYGNEAECGVAFAAAFRDGGICARDDVFITGKLWNSEHAPEHVGLAMEQTLLDLQLECLDLYLVHWPQAFQHIDGSTRSFPRDSDGNMQYDLETSLEATWGAMEALVAAGKTKSIGLSNFNASQIQAILDCATIKPAVLQVEAHVFFANEELRAFCAANGIVMTAYSPLGNGKPLESGESLLAHPVLAEIGAKYGDKTSAQMAIATLFNRGIPTFPKSTNAGRIKENFDTQFTIDAADLARIAALNRDARTGWGGPRITRDGVEQPRDCVHPNYPFEWK